MSRCIYILRYPLISSVYQLSSSIRRVTHKFETFNHRHLSNCPVVDAHVRVHVYVCLGFSRCPNRNNPTYPRRPTYGKRISHIIYSSTSRLPCSGIPLSSFCLSAPHPRLPATSGPYVYPNSPTSPTPRGLLALPGTFRWKVIARCQGCP